MRDFVMLYDNIALKNNSSFDQTSIVAFFLHSPLAEAINSGELDLSRDQTINPIGFERYS